MKIINDNVNSTFDVKLRSNSGNVLIYDVKFTADKPCVPQKISVVFNEPCTEAFSVWTPSCGMARGVYPSWNHRCQKAESRLASDMPILSVVSHSGLNNMTVSVTDAKTPIEISCGPEEFNKDFVCTVSFFTIPIGTITEYTTQIIIDKRKMPFYETICEAAERMRKGEQIVPDAARLPMYSTWYSFHQELCDEVLIKECQKAYELGMRSIIIDDGWQTDNNEGGYSYCGDWYVYAGKIKDMRAFADAVHNIGMKVMVWYSVPFVGKNSAVWDKFKGMYLDSEENKWNCLDPRFPKVREYLASLYEDAMLKWGIDGFKLDFIDSFRLTEYSDKTGVGRDFESLEDAIECLLNEITVRLKKINPDVLIEFRQKYTGPVITQYGNMIRVADCPLDPVTNRIGVLDLRMTSGKAAVHSDMIMWHGNDSDECAARHIIAILFGVPQISVRLDEISDSHYAVLRFWLKFWTENRDVLLDGKLTLHNPEAGYSMAEATLEGRTVCVCYSRNTAVYNGGELTVVNGTDDDFIAVKAKGDFKYTVLDCRGNTVASGTTELDGVRAFDVPKSGVLYLIKR